MTINWQAVQNAIDFYEKKYAYFNGSYPPGYRDWLLENWGIEHGEKFIKVVDEHKYMMFLLRFSR